MMNIPTAEEFEQVRQGMEELTVLVKAMMLGVRTPQVLKVSDIAEIEGVSRSQISSREVYLLPNFGISEFPDGVRRWKLETYLEWRRIPVISRQTMYLAYLERKRKEAVSQL